MNSSFAILQHSSTRCSARNLQWEIHAMSAWVAACSSISSAALLWFECPFWWILLFGASFCFDDGAPSGGRGLGLDTSVAAALIGSPYKVLCQSSRYPSAAARPARGAPSNQ